MKNKYLYLAIMIALISNSCNKEEQTSNLSSNGSVSTEVQTRASYINGTIIGEMNPYVGDGAYTYRISIPSQQQSVRIKISAAGGEAKLRRSANERYEDILETTIPVGTTQHSFDVLWTGAGSGTRLMARPYNSTIELNADLNNINVQMKPMAINAPSTFELGSNITLWSNYPLNKDAIIKWTYDKKLFSEISQSASVAQSKFQIDLKSLQPFEKSDIGVEVHDFYINSIGAKSYFIARKSNMSFHNIGPQINGVQNVEQYKMYSYSINDSKAHSFSWTGSNIEIIDGGNTSTVTIMPLNTGNSTLKVSYKYGDKDGTFTNEYSLNTSKTSMQLIGPDIICDEGTFTIKNFPVGATVDWVVSNGLFSALNRTSSSIALNNLATPGGSTIYATLTATVHTNGISTIFSKPFTFNMSGIQEDNHNITGFFSEYGGQCDLSPVPEGASDFEWHIDNGWSVDMQGYHTVSFSSNSGTPFSGTIWVTVNFTDGCGHRATIYNSFEVGSGYSQSSNNPKKVKSKNQILPKK